MKYVAVFFLLSCANLKQIKVEGVKKERSPFHIAWVKNQDPPFDTGNLPIALNSPLIYQDTVFVGSGEGDFTAFDLETGRAIWKVKDGGTFRSKPLAYKSNVIYGNSLGTVFSRNATTGKLNYSVKLDEGVEAQGVRYKGRVFFHTRNHKIFALDIETGRILWAYKRSVSYLTTMQRASSPLAHDNKLYVGFADGFVVSFNIEDGALLWESRVSEGAKFVDVDATPIIWDEKLVVPSNLGRLTFINPRNGNIIRRVQKSVYRAPLVIQNGNLVFGTTDGKLIVIDKTLNILKKINLGRVSISNIKIWRGDFLVSMMDRRLLLLDSEFNLKSEFDLGHSYSSVFGDIDIAQEKAAVLSSRNRLYLFK